MRVVLWFVALFGVAVAIALFAGSNQATVSVFVPPHRVDVSLNLVLLALALGFVVLHFALRALARLLRLPQQARRWRLLQRERAIDSALLDSVSHLYGGRYVRSRKSAELVLALEHRLERGGESLAHARRLRMVAHLLAAEAAHALQDRVVRDAHLEQALHWSGARDAQDDRDGVVLRGARWALDDRDADAALGWLDRLPSGARRRTAALRLRFQASRLGGQARQALETVRLLTKHRAYSELAGKSIIKGLALELIRAAHDEQQLELVWADLEPAEQAAPDVALEAVDRLLDLAGTADRAQQWLLPPWQVMVQQPDAYTLAQRVRLVRTLVRSFSASAGAPDPQWLARMESAQRAHPGDPLLQFLAGAACMRLGLWGKAQLWLAQSLPLLPDADLRREGWCMLAELAEQRNDDQEAARAYRQAARR